VKLLAEHHLGKIEERILRHGLRLRDEPGMRDMGQMVGDYIAAGGKRVRPQLAAWAFLQGQSQDDALPEAVLDLASGWELFHAFLLVHDDIIDGADTRRGQPALHVSLASLDSNSPRFGQHLGIVAGDLLFTAALEVWHSLDIQPTTYRDLMRLLSRVARITGVGQAIDIIASHLPMDLVDEETLLQEYLFKTAAYTFEGPMLSGAILAGLDKNAQEAISKFSLSLGQAYQLQNDLIDLNQPTHEGSDLVQGKRTVTIIRYRSRLSSAHRYDFDQRLTELANANGHTLELGEQLRKSLLADGVAGPTQQLIDELLDQAALSTQDPSLPPAMQTALAQLLKGLKRAYFV
jgi:geranylgeranyl diphosphate synthase, type I